MEDGVREILAKRAYETHLGVNDNREGYFKIDYCEWKDLPASTREHWKKIVIAIFKALDEVNCNDLDYGDMV